MTSLREGRERGWEGGMEGEDGERKEVAGERDGERREGVENGEG